MDYNGGDHLTQDYGYVRLYDYRKKSVTVGMGCDLGITPALL